MSISLIKNAMENHLEIPHLINDLVNRGFTINVLKTLFIEGGFFYEYLSKKKNKENISYLQLLAENTYCTFDGTRNMLEILEHVPNRLRDEGLTPEDVDEFIIIHTLVRSINSIEDKIAHINDFVKLEESDEYDHEVFKFISLVLSNKVRLYPGDKSLDSVRYQFNKSIDAFKSNDLQADLQLIYTVQIIRFLDKQINCDVLDIDDVLRIIKDIDSIDSSFEVIRGSFDAKRNFYRKSLSSLVLTNLNRDTNGDERTPKRKQLYFRNPGTSLEIMKFQDGSIQFHVMTNDANTYEVIHKVRGLSKLVISRSD